MGRIRTISISNFWGNRNIQLNLNPDINFLIGPNGTGKTTIISIITSTLRIDISSLAHLPFTDVSIEFDDSSYIKVKKASEERELSLSEPAIVYTIKSNGQEESNYEISPYEYTHLIRSNTSRIAYRRSSIQNIKQHIDSLVRLSWVSVNRTSILSDTPECEDLSSNMILEKLSQDLTGYFSLLQNKSNTETERFQKFIFSSLTKEFDDVQSLASIINTDTEPIKKKLSSIYDTFHIPGSNENITSYFDNLVQASQKMTTPQPLSTKEISILMNFMRIQSIVKEWTSVTKKQKCIFEKKELFLDLINNLFQHKKVFINSSNELKVRGEDGKVFDISFLSSGERQLLIILGQALLQDKGDNHIYIADEPELSLHIEWQEKLVSSIRRISSSSQIIFATHSPDIVGPYQDKTIKIDKIVYGD